MPDRKVAIFVAVSSEEQAKKYSLDAQLADCRNFVASIPERYSEKAEIIAEISMADTRSIVEFSEACKLYPGSYGILNDLIKRKQINLLVCIRHDRLGREESLILTIAALCRKHGIKIVAIKSAIPASLDPTNDEGSGYAVAVEAVAARVELVKFQDRRESGMLGRVTDLRLFPNNVPWGYSYCYSPDGEIKQIVMDEAIKRIVRRILIDLFLGSGLGGPAICKILNDEHVSSPLGNTWTRGGVRSILIRAARYAGYIEYNREGKAGKQHVIVKGNYMPMITEEEYREVSREYNSRKYHQRRKHRLLSGIVFCAGCNQPIHYRRRPKKINNQKTGEFYDTLACRNGQCQNPAEITEQAIIDALAEAFASLSTMTDDQLLVMASHPPTDTSLIQAKLDGLFAEQQKFVEERQRAVRAFIALNALTEAEFADNLRRIDGRLSILSKEIEDTQKQRDKEKERNQSVNRLFELRESGVAYFNLRDEMTEKVNQWLRKIARVTVKKGRNEKRRIVVDVV